MKKENSTKVISIPNSDISHYTRATLTKGAFAMVPNEYPQAVIRNSKGGILGTLQLSLDKKHYTLSDEEKQAFQTQMSQCIGKMSPATADVFDIVMSHWAKHATKLDSRVELNVDDVLEYRGKLKVLNGDKDRGGYHSEKREEVARQLQTLAYTYVEAQGTGYDNKKKQKKLDIACPVIVITGKYRVRDAITDHTEFLKINYGLGDYFASVMLGNKAQDVPRQVAYLPTPLLELDAYRQGYIRNLGGYLTFLWKNRQRNASYCDPINIATLVIQGMGIALDSMRPWRIRERLENALDYLEETGVIREWKYPMDFDLDTLPKKNWLKRWCELAIQIEPPATILDQYAKIKQPRKTRKQAQPESSDISEMREKRLKIGWGLNQLAEYLEVSASAVSRWEAGKNAPRGKTKQKIAKWLKQ